MVNYENQQLLDGAGQLGAPEKLRSPEHCHYVICQLPKICFLVNDSNNQNKTPENSLLDKIP